MNKVTLAAAAVLLGVLSAPLSHAQAEFTPMFDPITREFTSYKPSAKYANPVPREEVKFNSGHKPGTIIVNTAERRLYFVLPDGKAIKYGIGVGREGFQWSGVQKISRKAEWPSWTPPAQMLKRQPDLPRFMEGGPNNPLGARAMYLGSSLYRIHGSNEPWTIGQAVSSGCIRMTNEDVSHLYERAQVGSKVVVLQ